MCICPTPTEPDIVGGVDGGDDVPKPVDSVPPPPRCVLPGIYVKNPDLLGLDLSHHPSTFLHINEVQIVVVCLLGCVLG